jgi:sterol desaturase/sphingolipid hydroxylase (fatty acid hydroxylase superfamily)
MGPTLAGVAIALAVLAAVLWPLERLWPAIPGQSWRRPGLRTDLAYWFFTPLVTKALTRVAVIAAVVVMAVAAGMPLEREAIQAWLADPSRAARRQPAWLQAVEVLLIGDLVGYWTHRLFHGRRLWRFHAVHHASRHLDWLSSVRLHPVNDAVARMSGVVPILLLRFPPTVLAAYVPFLTLWAILLHANLAWSFGPFRYLVASPTFHRWHHTSEDEGLDKNFAGLFPFLDLIFGTFYMPRGREPQRFGLKDETVPEGLLAQLAYPYRPATRPTAEPGAASG